MKQWDEAPGEFSDRRNSIRLAIGGESTRKCSLVEMLVRDVTWSKATHREHAKRPTPIAAPSPLLCGEVLLGFVRVR